MDTESASFTWNQLTHLRIRQDVEKYVDGPLRCMGKLLSPCGGYLNELKIYKSVSLKLALRLRSSPVTTVLARLLRSLSSLVELQIAEYLAGQLDSLVNERIDTRSGKIQIPSTTVLTQCLDKLRVASSHLKCSIDYCTFAFGQSMMWLTLGHMNQHFLTLLASIARLSVLSKSLLVYSCDLYKGLYLILDKLQRNLFHLKLPVKNVPPSIDYFLLQLNLTPSEETSPAAADAAGAADERQAVTVEEPVLVQRPLDSRCDASPAPQAISQSVQYETPSSIDTIQLKIRGDDKSLRKKNRLLKRLVFSSPKMKRIFETFRRSKTRSTKKTK